MRFVAAAVLGLGVTVSGVSLQKLNIQGMQEPGAPAAPAAGVEASEPAAVGETAVVGVAAGDDVINGEAEQVYRPAPNANINVLKEFIRVEGNPANVALLPQFDDSEVDENPDAPPKAFRLKNLSSEPIVLSLEDNALNNYKLRLKKAELGILPLHRVRTAPAPSAVYQALEPKPTFPDGINPNDPVKAPTSDSLLQAVEAAAKAGKTPAQIADEIASRFGSAA